MKSRRFTRALAAARARGCREPEFGGKGQFHLTPKTRRIVVDRSHIVPCHDLVCRNRLRQLDAMRKPDLSKLYCSELVAAAHNAIGLFPTPNPARWSPNTLVRAERRLGILANLERIK